MALTSVTGFTAARSMLMEAATVVGGYISGDNLILQKHDGSTVNAGNVRGFPDATVSARVTKLETRDDTIFVKSVTPFTTWAAAINTALGSLPAKGGRLVLPAGDLSIDQSIVIPDTKMVSIEGQGEGGINSIYGTRLTRATGFTGDLISAIGSSWTPGRINLKLADLEVNGAGTADRLAIISRASHLQLERIRFAQSGGGVIFREIFDSVAYGVLFESLGGGSIPAVTFDAVAGEAQGAAATMNWFGTIFQGNYGTDLKLTGDPTSNSSTLNVVFIGTKMEAGVGANPYIDLEYAQHCRFDGLHISRGSSRTGPIITQLGSNSVGLAANVFSSVDIDARQGAAPAVYVDHGVSSLTFAGGVTVLGTPTTAVFRIQSTVGTGRFKLEKESLVTDSTREKLVQDLRITNQPTVASAATLSLPLGEFVSVTGTTTITAINPTHPNDVVDLRFTSTAQLTDGGNLKLAGNLTGGADRMIRLRCDGTNWLEVSRSVN